MLPANRRYQKKLQNFLKFLENFQCAGYKSLALFHLNIELYYMAHWGSVIPPFKWLLLLGLAREESRIHQTVLVEYSAIALC